MKRFDLRGYGADFLGRMKEIIECDLQSDEVGIFLFEVGDFSGVEKSAKMVAENGWTLMNSLRFNEVDWTIVVKKTSGDSALDNISKDSSLQGNQQDSGRESCDSSAKFCHITPPPTPPLKNGRGGLFFIFGLTPTYFLEKSKQKSLDLGDSRESSEILPTLNPQSCNNLGDSRESWGFKGATPPCSKSPSVRMGISTSPSPVGRGLGGGVSPKSIKFTQDSRESKNLHESNNPLDYRELLRNSRNDDTLADSRESKSCGFKCARAGVKNLTNLLSFAIKSLFFLRHTRIALQRRPL